MKLQIHPGVRFGRLTVVVELENRVAPSGKGLRFMRCRCDCGAEVDAFLANLTRGNTSSCGCLRKERLAASSTRHGHTSRGKSKTYVAWCNMLARCYKTETSSYPHYGGIGVTVCERWREAFDNFLADMGECPEGLSLDRYPDTAGNYEPSNCRWATDIDQARNKRNNFTISHQGETKTLAEWAEISGVKSHTLRARLVKWGWSMDKAMSTADGRVRATEAREPALQ